MNRTVERTFAILQLIAESKGGITLQEIANEMEMAKSSTYVIVQTLLELNYITTVQNNNKKYCLGIARMRFVFGHVYSQLHELSQRSVGIGASRQRYHCSHPH